MTKPKTIWWVDLPNPACTPDHEFVNIGTFQKRKEAFAFLREHFGMPTQVASFFITKGEDI